jgi:thiol:disulfide interchange protein
MLSYVRLFLILIGWVVPIYLSATPEVTPHVKVELIQEEETVQSGHPFWVAVRLNLEEGWHVYWKNPGDAGIPLKVEWELPASLKVGPLQWPFPEKFTMDQMVGFGYDKEVILLTQVTPASPLNLGETLNLKAHVKWLVCSESTCQPGSSSVSLPLAVTSDLPQLRKDVADLFERARAKIPQTHVEVKTLRRQSIVQLEVPQETPNQQKETVRGAYFFPEEKNVIDHSVDPTVSISTTHTNRYLVNLKGEDEIGAQSQVLKGVLVLHTQVGAQESFQAIDVESPIIDDGSDQEIIGLGDFSLHRTALHSSSTLSSQEFDGGLGLVLVFAFMGGILLNVMPCVLPVVSLKIMSFIKMAGKKRALVFKHGVIFSCGVVLSFWVLASLMLILRAYGQVVGWGFQLQEPRFVVVLATLLFILALNLFGVFEWGLSVASWAGQTEAERSQQGSRQMLGSFLSGILATAVATPCTGPFLGSAVGIAVTLPLWQALLIFTSLGLGMCSPYLLLAAFPSYLRFIPKPGPWMETFKQFMGFLLLATVLWLLWVFSAQTDTFSLICLLGGFLCFAIGAWIYGRGCTPLISYGKRAAVYLGVILFAVMGCQVILASHSHWSGVHTSLESKSHSQAWAGWEVFSPERVAQLRKQGVPVLIDFTAKWCLICQVNHIVLTSDEVESQLAVLGVVKMKADWTKNDPVITQELSKFGRTSVPLYVLYGGDEHQEPAILPQVLTADTVLHHLKTLTSQEEIVLND